MKKCLLLLVVNLLSLIANGQTYITNDIYSDTTWTTASSPFVIVGTITIHGVTLTIQPGVTVKFENGAMLKTINNGGQILAQGTVSDSITFTSNSPTPFAGIYNGIYFYFSFQHSVFEYCNFLYADKAIRDGSVWSLETIKNSIFKYNTYGIFEMQGGSPPSLIDSCIFRLNVYAMEKLYSTFIRNCIVDSNQVGITDCDQVSIANSYLRYNQVGITDLRSSWIDSCTISQNQTGLNFYNFIFGNRIINSTIDSNQNGIVDTLIGNNLINNCLIRNNEYGIISKSDTNSVIDSCFILFNQIGILNEGQYNVIMNSIVDSNLIAGIYFDVLASDNSVINCDLGNNQTGLIDKSNANQNTFTRNVIENNDVGILLENSNDKYYCNRICSNNIYDLKFLGTSNVDFSDNFWCSNDTLFIPSIIFDGIDTLNVGYVQFTPLDTLNCYLCNYNFITAYFFSFPTCPTCNDGIATVDVNGTPPYSYEWNTIPIQNTQIATGLTTGVYYTICVTDSAGCIECDSIYLDPTWSVNEIQNEMMISIFPNPFFTYTNVKIDRILEKATLIVYNSFGNEVDRINNIYGQNVIIPRGNLSGGMYFLQLFQDGRLLSTKKLLIAD